ncbi:MAG: cation transporter [Clostridia bacterium]|nr:cation transporter [Clostridia bacterium]
MLNKLIKDYDKPELPTTRIRVGRFAGFIGVIANIILFAIKLTVGFLTGSISIIADSLNNLSDSGASVLTVIGYTLTGKPADKDHPYGHARMEYLCSLFISIIIAFLGFEMFTSSIDKLTGEPTTDEYTTIQIIIIASTILVKIVCALIFRKLGKHINSETLKASMIDSISDVIATSAVVVGMLLTPITGPYTDAVIGIAISIYIMVMGIKLVVESSNTLLGKAPDDDFIKKIISKIRNYEGVLGIHDLVVHSYGENKTFVSVHVEVDADGNIMESHDVIDNIEADFLKENINLVVHMDPISISDPETNELRAKCMDIVSHIGAEMSSPISIHDFRIVKGKTHTNVLFDVNVSNELKLTNDELCQRLIQDVKKINPQYNLVVTIDRDYFSKRYGS